MPHPLDDEKRLEAKPQSAGVRSAKAKPSELATRATRQTARAKLCFHGKRARNEPDDCANRTGHASFEFRTPIAAFRKEVGAALVLSLSLGLWSGSVAYADDPIGSNTYREINANLIQRFQSNGTDPADLYQIIQRMESSDLERRDPALIDTQIEYGPGHWVYEWSALGEAALKDAEKALSDQETELARALFGSRAAL